MGVVKKPYILIAVVILIAGAIYLINSQSVRVGGGSEAVIVTSHDDTLPGGERRAAAGFLSREEKAGRFELAKEITTPDGFINTDGESVAISDFVGERVVLVDFWTYSCINCQRTTPYLNSWYEKYKDKGLVIIGVHTPEFEFEKNYDNVAAAVEKFGIQFPVVLDNDYSTWTAYKNRYWPRKYLIDIDGFIVYDHIGEGAYEETERKIQEALAERMALLGEEGSVDTALVEDPEVVAVPRSPEVYFGASRNQLFKNGSAGVVGDQSDLIIPNEVSLNALYFSGDWHIASEFSRNISADARIVYPYTAQDVFFVAEADDEIIVEVLRDGAPLGAEAGADVITTPDGKTIVKIQEAGLYKIIQDSQSGIYILEFRIQAPGLRVYTFTFG